MLKYTQFCDLVRQELAGHMRQLVWERRLLEAQPCGGRGVAGCHKKPVIV